MSWPVLALAGLLLLGGAVVLSFGRRCAVYRLPSWHRRPAYIGVAYNPARRMSQHHRRSWWWGHVSGPPQIRWYRNRAEALTVERTLIRREAPLFNDRHNLGRQVRPRGRIAA